MSITCTSRLRCLGAVAWVSGLAGCAYSPEASQDSGAVTEVDRLAIADEPIAHHLFPRSDEEERAFVESHWQSKIGFGKAPPMGARYRCIPGRRAILSVQIEDGQRDEHLQYLRSEFSREWNDDPNETYGVYLLDAELEVVAQQPLKVGRRRATPNAGDWSISESHLTAFFTLECDSDEEYVLAVERRKRTSWVTVWFEESAARWNPSLPDSREAFLELPLDAQRELLADGDLSQQVFPQQGTEWGALRELLGIASPPEHPTKVYELRADDVLLGYLERMDDGSYVDSNVFNAAGLRLWSTSTGPDGTRSKACFGDDVEPPGLRPYVQAPRL
jgi:hypothetical protein